MSKMKSLSFSLSAAALLAASPALADVDAAQLWAEWQAQAVATGQTMSADAEETADGLILRNFTTRTEQGDAVSTGQVDELRLIENADGTLSVEVSEVYTLTTTAPANPGLSNEMTSITFEMRHSGLEVTVSGDPGERRYDYSADEISIVNGPIRPAGGPPADVTIDFAISDLETVYLVTGGPDDALEFTSTGRFGGFVGTVDAAAPAGETGEFKLSFNMGETTSTGSGSLQALNAMSQLADGLPEGFGVSGEAIYERLSYEVSVNDATTNFRMAMSNDGGSVDVSMSDAEITYGLQAEGTDAQIVSSDFPVPIAFAVDSAAFGIVVPISRQDEPSDMALNIDYQGLTMSEAIWAMFDPGMAIPRDPATLVLDVSGRVQMLMDLIGADPAQMSGPPGELRDVSLNALRVSIGGAELTGEGDLDFPQGQIMPMPVGTIDLNLSGANGLLDRLTQAGLVPMEQAAMARGLAGMFARPGPRMDTLETTIEFLPGGGVTANGIPLQ